MANMRLSDETLQEFKSLANGQSADKFMKILMGVYRTNNNATGRATSMVPATEYQPNQPVVLPSGIALVDYDRYALDAFGDRLKYPGGRKDAFKASDYLQKMTGNIYQASDERDFRAAYFLRRWYTAEDEEKHVQARELEETSQFLASRGYALTTEQVSLTQ